MNIVSTFDGISCGQQALTELGFIIDNYFAIEINNSAIEVTQKNFPNTIQLGDIKDLIFTRCFNYGNCFFNKRLNKAVTKGNIQIDLFIGGSPCQSLSGLGDGTGLDGKSGLMYEYVRLLKEIRVYYPDCKFLLENVKPKKQWIDQISNLIGVNPIEINSDMYIPQSRTRLYWTNIKTEDVVVENTETLQTLLQLNAPTKYDMSSGWIKWWTKNKDFQIKKQYSSLDRDTAICLTRRMYASWNGNYVTRYDGTIRRLTPIECERLQMLPDNYTDCISDNQRYEALGNCWTLGPVKHIFKNIPI